MSTGPVDLTQSPHVVLRPLPVNVVRLQDNFWQPRITINRTVTIPAQQRHCEETGRIDNFRRAAGKIQAEFQGLFAFNDSDVYKWAEAAAWSLAAHPDPQLESELDAIIQEIADAQQPDGYLNTYFMFDKAPLRFTDLKDLHEIYCAGHLIQAAVAHHRATGKMTFLDVAVRLADHIESVFGPEPGKRAGACGHEEAEMALVELYRETGEKRYLNLARFMIDARGHKPGLFGNTTYHQDHLPFVDQTEMTGHAVRHMYLVCGAADVAAEEDAPAYRQALESLWNNFTTRRMYVTGGAGSRHDGESFGTDYELPNERAYAETCAAIGSVMWNWRMLQITGEVKYADLMEHTLYNAVLPGVSLDGTHYFYENPLADQGAHRRQEWFGCACCPPNIARLLASLPGYFYSVTHSGIWTHLYASGVADVTTLNGGRVKVTQKTDYPFDGVIEVTVEKIEKEDKQNNAPNGQENSSIVEFIYLRIPAWACGTHKAQKAVVQVNGEPRDYAELTSGGYIKISLSDVTVDVVRLEIPMPIEVLEANRSVFDSVGYIALQRGPLIYCIENADYQTSETGSNIDVRRLSVTEQDLQDLTAEFVPDLLGGICVLRGKATLQDFADSTSDSPQQLYFPRRASHITAAPSKVSFTAIPYYAWAHREPGTMQVWLPLQSQEA